MKKIIFALSLLFLSVNANSASIGTIKSIQIDNLGVLVSVLRTDNSVGSAFCKLTGDDLKTFVAIALTAKASGSTVKLNWADGGWTSIVME